MTIKPLYDKVLVKRMEPKEEVRGGIIIPDTAKEKPMEAEVISVGPGKDKDHPMTVKPGEIVLIGKYTGTEVKINDEEHLILREEEILAVLEK